MSSCEIFDKEYHRDLWERFQEAHHQAHGTFPDEHREWTMSELMAAYDHAISVLWDDLLSKHLKR